MATTQIGGGTTGAIGGAASGVMAGAALGPVGMIAGGILGGIFGSQGVDAPVPPTYSQLMKGTLRAQKNIQKGLLESEAKYRPMWQNLAEKTYQTQLYGGEGNEGYLSMLGNLQTQVSTLQEQAAANNFGMQARLAAQAREQLLSPEQQMLRKQMTQMGMSAMAAGRNLTPEQESEAQQSARAAMAARGLGGRQAVGAEVLTRTSYADAREARNLQLGQMAYGLESDIQNMGLQQAMGGSQLLSNANTYLGASGVLGDTQSKVFNVESQMAAQLAGLQYQSGMAAAQGQLQGRQQMLSSLGSLGSFAAMNPKMFSFGSTPSFNGLGGEVSVNGGYTAPIGPTRPAGY